ncbi:ankyrin repeat-containing domain protein [Mycena floridula]|nr:ankyrin repeat-containing domain protein [Mycena floridula]
MDHIALLGSLDKIASCATKLDLSSARVVFFSRLTSLQTIIRFVGARVPNDDVLQPVTDILCDIAMNLDMEQPGWPFTQNNEQTITAAIAHIESQLSSPQPELLSSPIPTKDVDPAVVTTYANGSSVHFHADHITGNIEGSFLSNNNIQFDADPAVRQGVDNLVERAIDAATIKKRKKFLDWISKLDFQATQMETFAKHSPGTGDWFLKKPEFVDWRDGKTKFLWCPGIPGAGKTILSSIIIDHLRSISGPAPAVLYIYCDYTHQSDQTPTQLLGSMLKQLVQYCPSISDHLLALHASYLAQNTFPGVDELLTALQTETSIYECVYIIVDALDECSEDNQARELFFPTDSQGLWSLPDHVHLLITSRDILSIAQEYHDEPKIPIEAHQDDLQTYIKGRIITDVKLKRLVKGDITLEAEIVDQVIFKAAGMQARLHLDSLASQLNRKTLRKALSSLPKGIMDSYDTAVARINGQGEAEYKLALQVFYWLAYAQRSLSVTELQHAITVSAGMTEMDFDAIVDVELLTDICAGLITIQKEYYHYEPIVQLVHYTTQEYFQLRQQLFFPNIHSTMAITCLTYLSFDVFNANHIPEAIWNLYPLYSYAASDWVKHACRDEAGAVHHILKFLEKEANIMHASNSRGWRHSTGKPHFLAQLGLVQTLEAILLKDHIHLDLIDDKGCTPFLYACKFGKINVVKFLLQQKDLDPNCLNINHCSPLDLRTPLFYATQSGHIETIELLLEQKDIDPNVSNKYHCTPLSVAAQWGHTDIVKAFLQRKDVNPAISDNNQRTPLSHAAEWGRTEIVVVLLQQQDVNPAAGDKDDRTPLSYAAAHNHGDIVNLLLQQKDVDFDSGDKEGFTPLSYAIHHNHLDIIKILLGQKRVILNTRHEYLHISLSSAAEQGDIELVKLLLQQKNVDPKDSDEYQRTALSYASQWGHIEIVKLLLQQTGVDPTASEGYCQRTPLSYAAEQGHCDIITLLLQHVNVDPTAPDKDQRTPLSYAAQQGDINTVKLLLQQNNVDPNASDTDGRLPLSYAAEYGHIEVVKLLLLHYNIDPSSSSKAHRTPLSYAAQYGHLQIMELLLLSHNAGPNFADQDQRTPLSYAAEYGHIEVMQLLLQQDNIDPTVSNKDMRTPLSYATQYSHFEVMTLLHEWHNLHSNVTVKEEQPLSGSTAKWAHFSTGDESPEYSN